MVKAIEYYPDGAVKRVEYKTAGDIYWPPTYGFAGYGAASCPPQPNKILTTFGGYGAVGDTTGPV